jgi:hypothetical protein
MIYCRLVIASLFAGVAFSAAAQESPSRTPPAAPALKELMTQPAQEIARGYLAAMAALPLAKAAADGLGLLGVEIDGAAYRVDAANGAQFAALFEERVEVYGNAITERGTAVVEGQYTFTAGPACRGEMFDPRSLFAGALGPDGTPLLPTGIRILQYGIDANMLVTFTRGREIVGELLPGTTVENTVVFTKAMGNGFAIYGTVKGNVIELTLDPEEVRAALDPQSGTDADWQTLGACFFTLTRR